MSDFFLPQMGDVLTDGVCFDTGLDRGNGDRRFGGLPFGEDQRWS